MAPPGTLRTDDQIVGYYRTTAEMLGDTPFVLQDFPLVTGVTIAPKVILEIVEDALDRPRGDPDDVAQVPLAQVGVTAQGDHHMRVVGQEGPRRQVGFRFDQRHYPIIPIRRRMLPG